MRNPLLWLRNALSGPTPTEGELRQVIPYLRRIHAMGGFAPDGEEEATTPLAVRYGFVSLGGGWGFGAHLTPKGLKAIARGERPANSSQPTDATAPATDDQRDAPPAKARR